MQHFWLCTYRETGKDLGTIFIIWSKIAIIWSSFAFLFQLFLAWQVGIVNAKNPAKPMLHFWKIAHGTTFKAMLEQF